MFAMCSSTLRSCAILGLALSLLVACQNRAGGARAAFVAKHSCPEAQVTVTERPERQYTPLPISSPSSEVAADPARLSVWQAERRKKEDSRRHAQSLTTVYEVAGCGELAWLRCDSDEYVSCSEE